ncbi:MAG: hypothetical protein ACQEXJ_22115 [Myxococcota bacterium]
MDCSMMRKVEKARQYASERDRFTFDSFSIKFRGSHHDHAVSFNGGGFECDCEFFHTHGACSHTMAVERMLDPMLHDGA